jgi:DNA-binding CsgD family transcriptional regulator
VLVGRSMEGAYVRATLDRAREGRGTALLLRGAPGIGKTALIEEAVRAAEGFRVLCARGVEPESGLAFAGLSDLLRPVLECLPSVPGAQRAALRAAMALGPPAVADRFAAYAATLSLIGVVAAERPLLIAVDDLHWIDRPTQEALAFCVRRIEDEPVAILVASRERAPERAELAGARELELAPLDDESARALLDAAAPDGLAAGVAREIIALAAGNPLELVELPRALSADERAGRAPLPQPLRAGEATTAAYRRRVEALDPGARRALLVAAAGGDGPVRPVAAAVAALGGSADLAAAEAAGFVVVEEGVARLRHPIVRSVVLELGTPEERREAHRALAEALRSEDAVEQRAWHLAEAAAGPDEDVGAALEAAAAHAAARTGYSAAAGLLERAAAFAATDERAGAHLLEAARMWFAAGDPPRAAALVERVWDGGVDERLRADAAHLAGFLAMLQSPSDDAFALLVREARRARDHEPAKAARMLCDAGLTRAMAGRCREALRCTREAASLAAVDEPSAARVAASLASALTLAGEAREARPVLGRIDPYLESVEPLSPEGQALVLSLAARTWLGELEPARRHVERWVDRARQAGCLAYLGAPQAFGAEIDFRRGRWTASKARAVEAVRSLEETGQASTLAFALATLAQVEAGRGREDDCRAHARRAQEIASRLGLGSIAAYRAYALGLLAQGLGTPDVVVDLLEPIVDLAAESGLREPATVLWQPELVEAYVRLGRRDDARRLLATLSEQAHRTGGVWARAATCRCRGLIDDDVDRHFREALALHALSPMPFERARTELAYGFRLRRARRRVDAREQLERARATFEHLGAVPWARRAREEIAATGTGLPRRGGRPTDELSPRELQVALTVATGLTNRESAARLFLSEKTIERHLGSVYRKLGLRSRAELARRFAERGPASAEPAQ